MAVKFSEDIIPLTDLKTNPGRVVRQVGDTLPAFATATYALQHGHH